MRLSSVNLKKHLFWIAAGLWAALLILGYMYKISPMVRDHDRTQREMANQKSSLASRASDRNTLYREQQLAEYKVKIGELTREIDTLLIKNLYQAQEALLERWYPIPGVAAGAVPPNPQFTPFHLDEKKKLHDALKAIAPKFTPDNINWNDDDTGQETVRRRVQKQYWICENIARILRAMKENGRSVEDIRIQFHQGRSDAKADPLEKYVRPVQYGPKTIGTTRPIQVEIVMSASDVPYLLKELLTPASDRLYFNLRHARIFSTLPSRSADGGAPLAEVDISKPDAEVNKIFARRLLDRRNPKYTPEEPKPYPVKLILNFDIIDLEPIWLATLQE